MTSDTLKQGFTTGAAAAAATKAALLYLINEELVEKVVIRCLNGEWLSIPIHSVKKLADQKLSGNRAEAIVIKDAGDDPDVTHKAEIGARISLSYNCHDCVHNDINDNRDANHIERESISSVNGYSIRIKGGEGVGIVTKPGLEVQPGNPAINSGPQKMIREAVNTVLAENVAKVHDDIQTHRGVPVHRYINMAGQLMVDVEIFVPKGRELAEKTLNARLGIIGGISILGTTGIVKPMSHDAYIATIRSGISVARAMGTDTLVFTTGRRSERVAISLFPTLPEESFIQIGDFFKASIDAAVASSEDVLTHYNQDVHDICDKQDNPDNTDMIRKVIIVVFFGKAVKMAMGFPHTHAAKSELTMKTLAKWAEEIRCEKSLDGENSNIALPKKIAISNTARHAFTHIYPDFPELISHVGNKIVESACIFSGNRIEVRSVILDFDGNRIFDSGLYESRQEIY